MRLIDADKVLDSYCNNCTQKSICEDRKSVCGDREAVYDALYEACTIDAAPAKHGTWVAKEPSRMKWIPDESDGITEKETTIEDMIEQKCSACQRWSIKFAHHIEMNFCPNCGAKMDGGKNDETKTVPVLRRKTR